MSQDSSDESKGSSGASGTGNAGKLMGGLLKKAVTLGAEAYVNAEDKVSKTLTQIPSPKDFVREAIEYFSENYTLTIQAEVKMTPKKPKQETPK